MSLVARLRVAHPGFTLEVALELPGRGVSAIFGPSGSGKTTLLRCIAGFERAPGGYVEAFGTPWQDPARKLFVAPHRRRVGYVFQEASLFAHLDVRGNLEYGRRRAPHDAPGPDASHVIDLFDLGALLGRAPAGLSGGERQRVAIARALLARPRLLVMDEPLAALDQPRRREILPYLERLHAELAVPLLYVSHAADEVARLADHLVLLDAGRVVAAGPLRATLARLDLPLRLGEDAGVVLEARVAERDAAWHLARLALDGGSLWVRDAGHALGSRVRVRILARDVSVVLGPPGATSILNHLDGVVAEVAADEHPAQALVRIDVGGDAVVARVTRRSAAALGLRPGLAVTAQVKAAALLD